MSNIALEEKIRNLSADYIYQQAVGSLLLLLMSAMEDAASLSSRSSRRMRYALISSLISCTSAGIS